MKKIVSLLFLICLFAVSEQNALASEGTTTEVEEITTEVEEITTEGEGTTTEGEGTTTEGEEITTEVPFTSELEPFAVPNENYYPGTNTLMAPGDILYSTKSLTASTRIVGHVGIVGPDYKIYHSNPVGDVSGKSDTFTVYGNRHGPNETINVYRPHRGAPGAANWAKNNYHLAIKYDIVNLSKLGTLSPNYCSKFIWQAFYFGAGINLAGQPLNENTIGWVTPMNIKNSTNVFLLTSFITR